MNNRKDILLLMFDLPSTTAEDRKQYTRFRKELRSQGYWQMQKSCYLKLLRNVSASDQNIAELKKSLPKGGNISVLPLSLNEFKAMKCLLGEPFDVPLYTDDIYCLGETAD